MYRPCASSSPRYTAQTQANGDLSSLLVLSLFLSRSRLVHASWTFLELVQYGYASAGMPLFIIGGIRGLWSSSARKLGPFAKRTIHTTAPIASQQESQPSARLSCPYCGSCWRAMLARTFAHRYCAEHSGSCGTPNSTRMLKLPVGFHNIHTHFIANGWVLLTFGIGIRGICNRFGMKPISRPIFRV